jgi:hypothetical protein
MLQTRYDCLGNMMAMPEVGRENEKYGRFLGQPRLDAALVALGARQHAIFGLDQLCELGFTARAVQKRTETGRLHRIYRGVYSLVPRVLLSRDGLYMAAVLACGPGAVLSHRSAPALHGLRAAGATKFDVTMPARGGVAILASGVTRRQPAGLRPHDYLHTRHRIRPRLGLARRARPT